MIRLMAPLFFCIVCLSSCDQGVSYTHSFDNKSSHKILVEVLIMGMVYDSVTVDAYSNEIVYSTGGLGGSMANSYKCTKNDVHFRATIMDNNLLKVKKDINNETNWTAKAKRQAFGEGDCHCLIAINDSDIQ